MRTVIISGGSAVPPKLRDLVERGSTSLVEYRAADLADDAASRLDADRVVFWSTAGDTRVRALADRYSKKEAAERREIVVFVTPEDAAAPLSPPLPPNEAFVWPRDEDRLKMAFLTGA